MILRNSYSDFLTRTYNDASQIFVDDKLQSNNFSYNQDVYSFYNSYYRNFRSVDIRAGLRLEHTEVKANFISDQNVVRQSYTHFIPSVSLKGNLSGKDALVFGFTQRVYRPGIWMLNPFVNRTNPRFISSGNPQLKAVLNNNFELIYTRTGKGSFSVGLGYLFANHAVQNVTTIQDTISYSVYQNSGKYRNLQFIANTSQTFNSKTSLTINGQVSHITTTGWYKGTTIKNTGFETNINANFSFKISETWRGSLTNGFIGPDILLQGRTNNVYTSSFNLTKLFFDKKLVVAVALNNPYRKFRYAKTYFDTQDFTQFNNLQRNYRSINFSAVWNLGSLKTPVRKTTKRILNDDTRQ